MMETVEWFIIVLSSTLFVATAIVSLIILVRSCRRTNDEPQTSL
jgi:hypothetical protein